MDCYAARIADLTEDNIKIIDASAWESVAAASPQSSFTRANFDELKSMHGNSIAITQLISALHSKHWVKARGFPYQSTNGLQQIASQPLSIALKRCLRHYSKSTAFLSSHMSPLPSKSPKRTPSQTCGSGQLGWRLTCLCTLAKLVFPIEIWLDLPPHPGYSFVDFHREWDAQGARQKLEDAVRPPQQPQPQEQWAPVIFIFFIYFKFF